MRTFWVQEAADRTQRTKMLSPLKPSSPGTVKLESSESAKYRMPVAAVECADR